MFADKENVLHAGPQSHHPHLHNALGPNKLAPRTPAGKAFPKTPMKIPLNDENSQTVRMPMTAKKSVFTNRDLSRNAGVTPGPANAKGKMPVLMQTPAPGMQTIKRKPLGGKSTNGKARGGRSGGSAQKPKMEMKPPKLEITNAPVQAAVRDVPDSPEVYHFAPPELPSGPDDDVEIPDYSKMADSMMVGVWSHYTEHIPDVTEVKAREWEKKMEEEALAWKSGRDSPVKRGRAVLGSKSAAGNISLQRTVGKNALGEKNTVLKPTSRPTTANSTSAKSSIMRATASTSAKSATPMHKRTTSIVASSRTAVPASNNTSTRPRSTTITRPTPGSTSTRPLTTSHRRTPTTISFSRPRTPANTTTRPTSSRPTTATSRPTTATSRPTTANSTISRPRTPSTHPNKPIQNLTAFDDDEYDSELEALEELDRRVNKELDGEVELWGEGEIVAPVEEDFFLEF